MKRLARIKTNASGEGVVTATSMATMPRKQAPLGWHLGSPVVPRSVSVRSASLCVQDWMLPSCRQEQSDRTRASIFPPHVAERHTSFWLAPPPAYPQFGSVSLERIPNPHPPELPDQPSLRDFSSIAAYTIFRPEPNVQQQRW